MTFIAPTGYSVSAMGHSPRSGQDATFGSPTANIKMDDNAIAGPSGSGSGSGQGKDYGLGPSIVNGATRNYADQVADSRRQSEEDQPISPSSAPPNPSVISVTHPPEFIHTHHPRRGSLTPLGLNVISPIPPISMIHGNGPTHTPHSPVRSLGFIPTLSPAQPFPDAFPSQSGRRGSGASSSSTLTLSRPSQLGVASNSGRDRRRSSLAPAFPIGFNPERRRSSLTPSIAQALPPSPTRTHANGVFGVPTDAKRRRPGTSDGQAPPVLHMRHHTSNGVRTIQQQEQANDARRGSMPQIHYGGWTGPKWNPSLPTQRGSVGADEALPDEEFKFGSANSSDKTPTQASAATFALKAIEISPSRRASKIRMDAFQEQEQEEAERQQRAFMAATYGADGRRARDRLSIGGPNAHTQPHAHVTPTPLNRRPSLMLWEKLGMAAAAKQFEPELAASSAPTLVLQSPLSDDEFGHRRGSLPIAIPYTGLGRSPSSRRGTNLDREQSVAEEGQSFGSEEGYERRDGFDSDHLAPIRPAPPLLPLSDPGPRLLPSTLALQRASHLLSSRNLQADPLPHPLPPSLHPPIPVDVTEFDIDFILAGSRAQLGGKRTTNAAIDDIAPFAMPTTATTLKLGADEEDSFAKFVGKFDDEYGGRRGEWTFRAKTPYTGTGDGKHPRSVWESPGAGSYDVYADGEVKSEMTGTKWRTSRKGICEYELEYIAGLQHSSPALRRRIGEKVTLTTKYSHGEAGGKKSPLAPAMAASRTSLEPPRPFVNRLRVSISEATRAMRLDSSDSGTTATAKMSSSLPTWTNVLGPAPSSASASHATTPSSTTTSSSKKNRRGSRDEEVRQEKVQSSSSQSHHQHRIARIKSREKEDEKKKEKEKEKDKEKPGFFKRGIIAPFKNSIAQYEEKKAQKEERERERQQAHSWSGVSASPGWIHPSGKNTPPPMPSPTGSTPRAAAAAGRSSSSNTTATASSVRTSTSDDHSRPVFATSSSGGDSRRASGSFNNWRQGKAWSEVPEDAVAMVLDCQACESGEESTDDTFSTTDQRQVLLVWYVPFNSEADDRDRERERERTSTTPITRSTLGSVDNNNVPPSSPSSSLPKFQKLLRRRASKDKEVLGRNTPTPQAQQRDESSTPRAPRHPLPFRSFRVVARLVDLDDLRSETDTPLPLPLPDRKTPSPQPNSIPAPRPAAVSVDSAIPKPRLVTTKTNTTTSSSLSASTAPTSTILAGRSISTVIAVCHSRSQGVEFVLEGLDRLGYCVGESAWGPTGYEEWRGTGLSERGRELLDLLWAGCTAVMGLAG